MNTAQPPQASRRPSTARAWSVLTAFAMLFGIVLAGTASAAENGCRNAGYACTPGYTGANANATWAGKYYGNGWAQTANGTHNCTLYVAWRLQQNGMPDPGRTWGNAADWLRSLGGDSTPTVGSVAWWGTSRGGGFGHVAFVEQVEPGRVFLRADNFVQSGGYTTAGWVPTSSVERFLHPFDRGRSASGGGMLQFVKTKNTGSRTVEVHTATPGSGYKTGSNATSWFSPADADNGWFQMVGADLYFIKTKNTGSGRVEVHTATAASGFRSGAHHATAYSSGDANNGWFQIDGGDLVFIKTKKTGSGRVEYFRASAASGFQKIVTATGTAFRPADADNGWFQSQAGDLIFLKTKNAGSGRVEYFRATRSSNYRQITVATGTAFSPADADNGWFSSEDVNGDGRADLVFVKTKNVQSGRVELFVADGARNFQQLTSTNVTWFGPGDSDNGWFQIDGKQ